MLESMINAPRPTRAEASDVANAVLDGSDMVMLSGESAGGSYPTHAVGVMARTCVEAENSINYRQTFSDAKSSSPTVDTAESVARSAASAVLDNEDISVIVVMTETGKLARLVAKYRPGVPILACS
jgi:pyruvate kinase